MKPFEEGKLAFRKGTLGNPYTINTKNNRDWEYGFNIGYFKNLEKVKKNERQQKVNLRN
tara:strand:+ start:278 stop:454 length:177 start_codon:yes stop_codon:yes gene_type:complete